MRGAGLRGPDARSLGHGSEARAVTRAPDAPPRPQRWLRFRRHGRDISDGTARSWIARLRSRLGNAPAARLHLARDAQTVAGPTRSPAERAEVERLRGAEVQDRPEGRAVVGPGARGAAGARP